MILFVEMYFACW